MIRLFFIEQDIARATNKQKFPMQTNTGHWTLPFEYIFSKIYRKKHFIRLAAQNTAIQNTKK